MVVLRAAWLWLALASAGDVDLAHIHYYGSTLPEMSSTKKSRPVYHINSPSDYLTVPAAFVKFRKEYHVFFQIIPYSSITRGYDSWGHVASNNLVDWKRYPTTLAPKEIYEEHGCLAGSAIEHNGYLTIFYTGNYVDINQTQQQTQNLAISADGIIFQKYLYNPIITSPPNHVMGEFRNPKVWFFKDKWYMIVCSMTERQLGQLLLYVSHDLFSWKLDGTLASSFGDMGFMWESPDLFEIDGTYVLLLCARGVLTDLYRFRNLYQTGYLLGNFDYVINRFSDEFEVSTATFNILDHGHDFYAPKTTLDSDGRRLLIAWLGMWETTESTKDGWKDNILTIVRELRIDASGHLLMSPVRETTNLRREVLENAWYMPGESFYAETRAFELIVNTSADANLVRVSFERGRKKFEIEYNAKQAYIMIDRGGMDGVRRADWSPRNDADSVHWRIFVDHVSVELFCGEGEVVFSSRIKFRRTVRIHVGGDTLVHMLQYRLRRSVSYLHPKRNHIRPGTSGSKL